MAILLERADNIAKAVRLRLEPYCFRDGDFTYIQVAGSVRRRVKWVNDVDFVLIPSDAWNLYHEIKGLGQSIKDGPKIKSIKIGDCQVDFYFATKETWATLLLVRTGSVDNNKRLCAFAKKKGWHLSASGEGLFDQNGKRVAGDTEESIYNALRLAYQPPERRN